MSGPTRGGSGAGGRQLDNGTAYAVRPAASQRSNAEIQASSVSLSFPDWPLPYDEWRRAGARIVRMVNSSAWYLGDWLVYGETQYTDRYREAVESFGLNYQTLRNYAWVARRFPPSRRRDKLNFHHHMEVAKFSAEEQDHWLDQAIENRWSVQRLRQHLQQAQHGVPESPGKQQVVPKIKTDELRIERWHAAAKQASTSFEYWVVASLDRAANNILDTERR